MNANDHVPMVNIMPFGFCKKGMPCMPLTPVAWVDVNKKHIIDGAPALTEDSKLACAHGGVITIVPLDAGSAEEGDRNENAEDVVEEIASAALSILGSIAAKRIPFMKKLVKMRGKKKNAKGGGSKDKGSGSNGGENSGAASNRSLDKSGNNGGESKKAGSSNSTRDNLLENVDNQKLKNAIGQIYRPGASVGDGGLADAIKHELSTGQLVGGKSHIQKGAERVKNLENILTKENLSQKDRAIAEKLLNDLKDALKGVAP